MRISRYHHIALVLLLFSQTTLVRAQEYWEPAPGPYGGTAVADLEIDSDGRVYAATSNGVFSSLDDGLSWSDMSSGLVSTDVRDLLIQSDGTLWIATYGAGLFKWNEFTETWEAAGLAQTYASSIIEAEDGSLVVGTNGYVYISTDSGDTWQVRSLEGYLVNVQDLASNSTHLFAASSLGIFRSADAGETWEFASFGIQEFDVRSIETDAGGTVYAGVAPSAGGCALYRSRGNGSIWTCIQPSTDPLLVPVLRVNDEGILFAGGFKSVLRSDNEGNSWQVVPASGSTVDSIVFTGSCIIIGTQGLGVLRSEDGGNSWTASNTGMQSRIQSVVSTGSGALLVGTEGGLFRTTDYADSWDRLHPDDPLVQRITDVLVDSEDRIVAATGAGVWRLSPENGWEALGPPGMPSIRDLAIRDDGSLLASYHSGIYEFDGFGWIDWPIRGADQGLRDVSTVLITPENTVLAGAAWDSWRQIAGSASWSLMSVGDIPWFDVQTFAQHEGTILGGTKYLGVVQSVDDGQTWQSLSSGLNGREDVRVIGFDPHGRAHIGTYGSGVFQLNPWTRVWVPVNFGLEGNHRIVGLDFDPLGNGYVGSVDGGLYRHIVSRSVGTHHTEIPASFSIGVPYPNPSASIVRIPVLLGEPGSISIDVMDVLGRRVYSTTDFGTPGTSDFVLDVSGFAAGTYLIRIQHGSGILNGSFVVAN